MSQGIDAIQLDPIERGGHYPQSALGAMAASSEASECHVEPLANAEPSTRPRSSTASGVPPPLSERDIRDATGYTGLAQLKSCDVRFTFYHAFIRERLLLLELRAEEVIRLSRTMETLTHTIETSLGAEPNKLPTDHSSRAEWMQLKTRLEEELERYGKTKFTGICSPNRYSDFMIFFAEAEMRVADLAFIRAKTMIECQPPKRHNLEGIRRWLRHMSKSQEDSYAGVDVDDFRMIGPSRGPIETFVKDFAPENFTDLYRSVLKYLHREKRTSNGLDLSIFNDTTSSRVQYFIVLAAICVFIVLPLPLMYYFEADRAVRASVVSIMSFLVSLAFLAENQDEERRFMLICAYCAILGGFLS